MITDEKVLEKILERLEMYYPEHKIFAFDSLLKKERENLGPLSKKFGFASYEELLKEYGFEIISGNEVKKLRSEVIYTPGNEPEFIATKINNMLKLLNEYYPDKKITRSLQAEHKSLASTVSGLYQWLGYESAKEILSAYGYEYNPPAVGGQQKHDYFKILDEIKKKYENTEKPESIKQIVKDFPEYKGALKTLQNNSNELLGKTLADYLKEIGIIKEIVKVEKPRPAKYYNYFMMKLNGEETLIPCIMSGLRTVVAGDVIKTESGNYGTVEEVYYSVLENELPVPLNEIEVLLYKMSSKRFLEDPNFPTSIKKKYRTGCEVYTKDGMIKCVLNGFDVKKYDIVAFSADDATRKTYGIVGEDLYTNLKKQKIREICIDNITDKETAEKELDKLLLNLYPKVYFTAFVDCGEMYEDFVDVSDIENTLKVGDVIEYTTDIWCGENNFLKKIGKINSIHRTDATMSGYFTWGTCNKFKQIVWSREDFIKEEIEAEKSMYANSQTNKFNKKYIAKEVYELYDHCHYINGAIFKGVHKSIKKTAEQLYTGFMERLQRVDKLNYNISQIECPCDKFEEIIKSYPELKAICFAENWDTGEVYLAYSESGYDNVTSMRFIGKCNLYEVDRWPLIHDPSEEEFVFNDGEKNSKYTFEEKELWEKFGYVDSDKNELLTQDVLVPSKPFAKKTMKGPVAVLEIKYPEHEQFFEPEEKSKNKTYGQAVSYTKVIAESMIGKSSELSTEYARKVSSKPEHIDFNDKIFVHTSCQNEKMIDGFVETNGGEIKSSTVLNTNYLIIGDNIDHQTTKISRAIELNNNGKSITAMTESEFWSLVAKEKE